MLKNQILTRNVNLEVLSSNDEERSIDYVITSEAEDSYKTVFTSDGWDFKRYHSNPVVLYLHDDTTPDPDLVLGISEIRQEGPKTIGRVFYEPADLNPLADKVYRKSKRGTLKGASIRAQIHEARYGESSRGENPETVYFTKQELLEFSIVPIPSNPEALRRNFQTVEDIRKLIAPAPPTVEGTTENRCLGLFDAQLIINQNSL